LPRDLSDEENAGRFVSAIFSRIGCLSLANTHPHRRSAYFIDSVDVSAASSDLPGDTHSAATYIDRMLSNWIA
jgi:hypothetical protein